MEEFENYTITQLRNYCKEHTFTQYTKLNKKELLLYIQLTNQQIENTLCPICYDNSYLHQFKCSTCSYKSCNTCYSKLHNCPICRVSFQFPQVYITFTQNNKFINTLLYTDQIRECLYNTYPVIHSQLHLFINTNRDKSILTYHIDIPK